MIDLEEEFDVNPEDRTDDLIFLLRNKKVLKMNLKTACDILQISANASNKELNDQYCLLLDKYRAEGLEEQLIILTEAYNIMIMKIKIDKNAILNNIITGTTDIMHNALGAKSSLENLKKERLKIKSVDKSKHIDELENDFVEYIKEERMLENKQLSGFVGMISNYGNSNMGTEALTNVTLKKFKYQSKRRIDPVSIFLTMYLLTIIVPMRKISEDLELTDTDVLILTVEYLDDVEIKTKQEFIDYFSDSRYIYSHRPKNIKKMRILELEKIFDEKTSMLDLEEAFEVNSEDRTDDQFYMVYNYTLLQKLKSYLDFMI